MQGLEMGCRLQGRPAGLAGRLQTERGCVQWRWREIPTPSARALGYREEAEDTGRWRGAGGMLIQAVFLDPTLKDL